MFYVIWKDYDMYCVDEFEEFDDAQCRVGELMHKFELDNYGGEIIAVIEGERKKIEIVEVVKEVKLS